MPAETHHTAAPLLMDAAAVANALSIGERTLWRWVSTGTFPRPDISIGGKIRRWKYSTVQAWIDLQSAENAGQP